MTHADPYLEYLDRMPKVDLHVHMTGTVRASTFEELARREGLDLPEAPAQIYRKINSRARDLSMYAGAVIPCPTGADPDEPEPSYALSQVARWVRRCMTTPDDYRRIAYEACEDASTRSTTRHIEFFINPPHRRKGGLGYAQVVDAYTAGLREAEDNFAMSARLIVGIDRSRPGIEALARVQEMVANPREYVIGIGLNNLETAGPPEQFVDAYRLARDHGLRRTAHSSEHVPSAANTTTCLDELGCDRIDHGYFVLQDDAVVERCRQEQVPFTCIFTTSRRAWRPWRRASIKEMVHRGLNVTLATDDPGMFPTTLTQEYRIAATELGFDRKTMRGLCLNGIEACWLNEMDKAELRANFVATLNALEAELFPASRPASDAADRWP
jgi:adenosine deaminase